MGNNNRTTIGIILCIIFGVFLLTSSLITGFFFEHGYFNLVKFLYIFTNLALVAATIFAGLKKDICSSLTGKVGAFGLSGLYSILVLNQLVSFLNHTGFLHFGIVSLMSAVLIAVFMGLFLFNLKTWLPIKITGLISCIPGVISGAILMKLSSLDNYTDYTSYYNAIDVCNAIEGFISLAVIVLTIIWMANKPTAPSVQSQQIDMI